MHLRRALLLFAIVIGLAALAASVSQPRDDDERAQEDTTTETTTTPTADDGQADPPATTGRPGSQREAVTLKAGKEAAVRAPTNTAVTLSVDVKSSGRVDIPGLGLTAPGEPLTPARFELFLAEPGRYELRFSEAGTDASTPAGTLVAVEAER